MALKVAKYGVRVQLAGCYLQFKNLLKELFVKVLCAYSFCALLRIHCLILGTSCRTIKSRGIWKICPKGYRKARS